MPVVVVRAPSDDGRYVLIDGFKRVRGLIKLRRDTVRAVCWEMREGEALLLGRLMQTSEGDSALEQGWLLRELRERFELTVEELARRFDRSPSWVSRRLGLVSALPERIQELVREGRLVPHAAMKFLLPLARANQSEAIALAEAIAPLSPSTRQTEALCLAFARGGRKARRYLLRHPELFLRARETGEEVAVSEGEQLQRDVGALGGVARRAVGRVTAGAVRDLLPPEQQELRGRAEAARGDVARLFATLEEEIEHARRAHADDDSEAS